MSEPRDWLDAGPQDVPDRDPNEGDPFEDDEPDEATGMKVGELFDSLFCRGLGTDAKESGEWTTSFRST